MKTPALNAGLHPSTGLSNNEPVHTLIYDLMNSPEGKQNGLFWQSLSEEQKLEVMRSYEESQDEVNLVPAELVLTRK